MEIKTCKECIYYVPSVTYPNAGMCTHPMMCDDSNDTCSAPAKDGVYATCDEYRGELWVGEDFGCIHFKTK